MFIILKSIIDHLSYIEFVKLLKKCPYLIYYYDYNKEGKYYNQHNLYRINDYLPNNLIYKENLYYYIKLMSPIYFYLNDFKVLNVVNNYLILKSENINYINFFLKLRNIIIQSFKKNYYQFDTGIIVNNNNILVYILTNEFELLNLDYNSNKFLIKYIGVRLENYSKMINNFQLIKSF